MSRQWIAAIATWLLAALLIGGATAAWLAWGANLHRCPEVEKPYWSAETQHGPPAVECAYWNAGYGTPSFNECRFPMRDHE